MDVLDRVLTDLAAVHPDTAASVRRATSLRPADGCTLADAVDARTGLAHLAVATHPSTARGFPQVATLAVCASIAEALLWPAIAALTLHGRAWGLADAWLAADADGEPVVELGAPAVAVGSADALAGAVATDPQGVVLAGRDEVITWAAGAHAPILLGLVDALAALGVVRRSVLWATVGSQVSFSALVAAHRMHTDDAAADATATRFLDEVTTATGDAIRRAPLHTVDTVLGPRLAPTKAACCLRFRDYQGAEEPLCRTCPRRPRAARADFTEPWVQWLCVQREHDPDVAAAIAAATSA